MLEVPILVPNAGLQETFTQSHVLANASVKPTTTSLQLSKKCLVTFNNTFVSKYDVSY